MKRVLALLNIIFLLNFLYCSSSKSRQVFYTDDLITTKRPDSNEIIELDFFDYDTGLKRLKIIIEDTALILEFDREYLEKLSKFYAFFKSLDPSQTQSKKTTAKYNKFAKQLDDLHVKARYDLILNNLFHLMHYNALQWHIGQYNEKYLMWKEKKYFFYRLKSIQKQIEILEIYYNMNQRIYKLLKRDFNIILTKSSEELKSKNILKNHIEETISILNDIKEEAKKYGPDKKTSDSRLTVSAWIMGYGLISDTERNYNLFSYFSQERRLLQIKRKPVFNQKWDYFKPVIEEIDIKLENYKQDLTALKK